jgi:hypothetical protein
MGGFKSVGQVKALIFLSYLVGELPGLPTNLVEIQKANSSQRSAPGSPWEDEDKHMYMDEREAFHEAVYRFGEWSPALPEHPKVMIKGQAHTIREVCGLMTAIDELPDGVVGDLLSYFEHDVHSDLTQELSEHRTYAVGGRCLLELMKRREAKHELLEDRRNR